MLRLVTILRIPALLSALLAPLPCAAAQPAAELCEWATRRAAAEIGVPADILAALTLTETGRRLDGRLRPWAWSANAEGEGSWFDDPARAIAFAEERLARGRVNLDIGCFQLNYRWHGGNFASVAQMFEPLENARYAARFLRQLHGETGDWRLAAGAFHSRTPVHAQRYLARFDLLHQAVRAAQGSGDMAAAPEAYNSFAAVGTDQDRPARQGVTPLGAPPGSPPTGRPGSLAVLASRRPLLGAAAGPVIAAGRGGGIADAPRHPVVPP